MRDGSFFYSPDIQALGGILLILFPWDMVAGTQLPLQKSLLLCCWEHGRKQVQPVIWGMQCFYLTLTPFCLFGEHQS